MTTVNITRGFEIQEALSLDASQGVFWGSTNPSITSVGDVSQAPVGSLYFFNGGTSGTNVFQRWGTGDLDWRPAFIGTITPSKSVTVNIQTSASSINKLDYFPTAGGATDADLFYAYPYIISIYSALIYVRSCSSANQNILLLIEGQPDITLASVVKSATEQYFLLENLNITVPSTKKIRLRVGNLNGSMQDVVINMVAINILE